MGEIGLWYSPSDKLWVTEEVPVTQSVFPATGSAEVNLALTRLEYGRTLISCDILSNTKRKTARTSFP